MYAYFIGDSTLIAPSHGVTFPDWRVLKDHTKVQKQSVTIHLQLTQAFSRVLMRSKMDFIVDGE